MSTERRALKRSYQPYHNVLILENTQINKKMLNKLADLYTRALLSNKREGTTDPCNNHERISKTLCLVKKHYIQNSAC